MYVLYDYTDASEYQNRYIFASDTAAIRLHFYIDDLELCNPLGSAKKTLHFSGLLPGGKY